MWGYCYVKGICFLAVEMFTVMVFTHINIMKLKMLGIIVEISKKSLYYIQCCDDNFNILKTLGVYGYKYFRGKNV